MTILTYEEFFEFYALTNYDDEKGGYYDTQDSLAVQWRIDVEQKAGQLQLILWDDYHDTEFSVQSSWYDVDELTPDKCFDIYEEELHNLFFAQDEDTYQIIEENYPEWRKNLKSEPTAGDFADVRRLEGLDEETSTYVTL